MHLLWKAVQGTPFLGSCRAQLHHRLRKPSPERTAADTASPRLLQCTSENVITRMQQKWTSVCPSLLLLLYTPVPSGSSLRGAAGAASLGALTEHKCLLGVSPSMLRTSSSQPVSTPCLVTLKAKMNRYPRVVGPGRGEGSSSCPQVVQVVSFPLALT